MPSEAGDADGRSSPIMFSGELIARMRLTTSRSINLSRSLDTLIDELDIGIRARRREDPPPADKYVLLDRYLVLCDIHMKVYDSMDCLSAYIKDLADTLKANDAGPSTVAAVERSLASYLDVVDKELADLAAATNAALRTKAADSSTSDTADRDQAAVPVRSRI